MNDASPDPTTDNIEYMQTVRDGQEKSSVPASSTSYTMLTIDPPRKPLRKLSLESDNFLTTDNDDSIDEDYLLSSSSSDGESSYDITNNKKTLQNVGKHKDANVQGAGKNEHVNRLKDSKKANSFMDVLNEIMEEKPDIPSQNNLGPKPWLMKKTKQKYEVSDQLFVYKPKQKEGRLEPVKPIVSSEKTKTIEGPSSLYDTPPSRGRMSSSGSGNATSDNERSVKNSSEPDTGFCSNASSNPSPSNSLHSLSRSSSRDEKQKAEDGKQNAQELARAALQALSLSKNILQDMEKEKVSNKTSDPDSIYDEVPMSPVTSPMTSKAPPRGRGGNVYDDVPPHDDVIKPKPDPKRTVISVPIYKPPDPPTRNDKNHVISSEPLYDITRSNTKTPQNVSSDALDLMYQLFGKDLTEARNENVAFQPIGYNQGPPPQQQYGRPPSVKSVKFEDEMRQQDEGFPSRPSSRAGSVYSEWSDCTLNMSDYPESEATTIPRADAPRLPEIGYPPMNPPQPPNQPPNFPQNTYNQMFPGPNPSNYTQRFPQGNMGFPNDPIRPQSNPYQPPNNPPFDPRNPVFPNPTPSQPLSAPMFPLLNTNYMPHEIPGNHNYPPNNPFPPRPMGSGMDPYSRPPPHALSPPRQGWGGFSPPREPRHPYHHHHMGHHHGERRGRQHGRHFSDRGRPRSHSRSRQRRHNYHSDDEDTSRSLSHSPLRHSPLRHRDVISTELIAGKSYIDGYKAALKDAVMTFAERQGLKRIEPYNDVESQEDRLRKTLRRTLSAGRIRELPDDIELGDIRRALAGPDKAHSDDELDVFDRGLDFTIPSAGRPLSRNGSQRSLRGNQRRYPSDDDVIDLRHRMSDSDHDESCDCSECEEAFEMTSQPRRYYDDEPMTSRARRNNEPPDRYDDRDSSPRMRGLRQRYMETFEESSNNTRAPVRAHNNGRRPPYDDDRARRAEERRRMNYEDVRFNGPRQQQGYRNGPNYNRQRPGNGFPPPQQRGDFRGPGQNDWQRRKGVRFGYQ